MVKKLFYDYCNFCSNLTRHHKINLNEINKNNDFISNNDKLFLQNMNKSQPKNKNPTDFLSQGLDFNDDELLKYFENLII